MVVVNGHQHRTLLGPSFINPRQRRCVMVCLFNLLVVIIGWNFVTELLSDDFRGSYTIVETLPLPEDSAISSYHLTTSTSISEFHNSQGRDNNKIINNNMTFPLISHRMEQENDCFRARPFDNIKSYLNDNNLETLPKPWIHIGMPKTGTTTLEQFWKCGLNVPSDADRVSHSVCKVSSESLRRQAYRGQGIPQNHSKQCPSNRIKPCRLCGNCMSKAKTYSFPLLESCGNYEAWAQLDSAKGCFYPQWTDLELIHAEAPNATFAFMFRDMEKWVHSVRHFRKGELFFYLKKKCFPEHWKNQSPQQQQQLQPSSSSHDPLKELFCGMVQHARQFVSKHPSHAYVEIDLDDPSSSRQLASQAFGISESCWGMHNINTKIHMNDTTTKSSEWQ